MNEQRIYASNKCFEYNSYLDCILLLRLMAYCCTSCSKDCNTPYTNSKPVFGKRQ